MDAPPKSPRRNKGPDRSIDPARELALLALCHLDAIAPQDRAKALCLLWDWAENAPVEQTPGVRPLPAGQSEPEFSAGGQLSRLSAVTGAKDRADALAKRWIQDAQGIDALIEEVSQRWRLSRMEATDRNAIRLAAMELQESLDGKRAVVADAVRLASRYGGDRSARFVNGVVESLAQRLAASSAE